MKVVLSLRPQMFIEGCMKKKHNIGFMHPSINIKGLSNNIIFIQACFIQYPYVDNMGLELHGVASYRACNERPIHSNDKITTLG